MPVLTDKFYTETLTKKTRAYIETGSYVGKGLIEVVDHYDEIHSIELALEFYHFCKVQFMMVDKIHMHYGNSKDVLPEILDKFDEPVTVFLDGHFLGGKSAFGDEEIEGVSRHPLQKELEILLKRPYDDIIIIDDCRCIGNKGVIKGNGTKLYPDYDYDWTDITEDSIRNLMKPGYELYKNDQQRYASYYDAVKDDQWILAPKPTAEQLKNKKPNLLTINI